MGPFIWRSGHDHFNIGGRFIVIDSSRASLTELRNSKDMIFVKHQHYIPIRHTISRNITYINIMRDPVKRFISGYYFWRFCFEYFSSANQTIQRIDSLQLPFLYKIIDRKWLDDNVRICHDCEDNRLYFLTSSYANQDLMLTTIQLQNRNLWTECT